MSSRLLPPPHCPEPDPSLQLARRWHSVHAPPTFRAWWIALAVVACNSSDHDPAEVGGASAAGGAAVGSLATAGVSSAAGGVIANASASDAGGLTQAGGAKSNGGAMAPDGSTSSSAVRPNAGSSAAGGANATGGANASGSARTSGGANATGGTKVGGAKATGGVNNAGGANTTGGAKATGGANTSGGAKTTGGVNTAGGAGTAAGARATGGANTVGGGKATGGQNATAGSSSEWPNIRVVDNHLCDRWGKPFSVRGIESMFGNGSSNAKAFVAGHKALGANAIGPLPNSSVTSAGNVEGLLSAAYDSGLVVGLNADHTNQGERFFSNTQIQALVNRYPNVFLQEAVELGSDMSENEWVQAAKDKVDAYVDLYPDKPLKIGSPSGGRSPRFPLNRCEEVVDYYYAKGGHGGLIFTCQLYWKAANSSWSYQEDNGFSDGLAGILEAVDAMAASPCMFLPGLDNQDDVGYTGWREVMDHVRASSADPAKRLGFQWWVYYNSGDTYANDLTTNANDALAGITSTGRDVKAKLELDRQYIELGPMNP